MRSVIIGIVTHNVDPKGYERIRYKPYGELIGPVAGALPDSEMWGTRDLFVARPFLPQSINHVPDIGQTVRIITYDSSLSTTNQEYISGPFTTSFDFESQTFTHQLQGTSYGTPAKLNKDILTSDGEYIDKVSEGALPKNGHQAFRGNYGSDLIFTDDGVVLSGGKLVSKKSAKEDKRKRMISIPHVSKTSSRLFLKKFPTNMVLKESQKKETQVESTNLKYIFEYSVDDISNPRLIYIYAYKVNSRVFGPTYSTKYFTEFTELTTSDLTLINISGNTGTSATFIKSVSGLTESYVAIRTILATIEDNGLNGLGKEDVRYSIYPKESIFPFYFRPTKEFRTRSTSLQDKKIEIIENVYVRNKNKYGLIWSSQDEDPPSKTIDKVEYYTEKQENSPESSYGALVSDKIYFLSTDTNESGKPIDFTILDKYEYTQDNYVNNIHPYTYSSVRGENLLNLLIAIINVLVSHKHNINDVYARSDFDEHRKLMELVQKMENDLLNKSIRIN